MSEAQVLLRLSAADRVRQQSPRVWAAFMDGRIDLARVRDIAGTIDKLKRPESIQRLDEGVVDHTVDHTAAELRGWLRRFVQRVEADLAVERAEVERERRHVSVSHVDDGMGWLNAYLPSQQLAAIEERLRREARRADDERTVAQREADLLAAWCTDSDAITSSTDAHIAVMIDADVLAGAVAGFAESSDGRWGVPASWITEIALTGSSFWHRMVLDPVNGDVLSHEYLGRYAPDVLAVAVGFRDGVCQAPGCLVPASRCDIDHRVPHPDGPTSGDNLGPLCRRHHALKGHGVLRWSIGPPKVPDPVVIEIYPQPVHIEYVA